ncbi:Levansucrase, partial [Pseudomonas amygdali pv. lachrymans]
MAFERQRYSSVAAASQSYLKVSIMSTSSSAVSQLKNSPLAGNINYEPTVWSRADALKVNENDPTTTQPLVSADFPVMSDTVFIWDTMPLRELDGTVVSVNGWSVILTLTADRHPNDPQYLDANGRYDIKRDWEDRHGRARMCYWYSRTGKDWIFGGRVMA